MASYLHRQATHIVSAYPVLAGHIYDIMRFRKSVDDRYGLTPRQAELLDFIRERLKETGIPPSFDEMKEALGLSSKASVHRLVTALVERGHISRLTHRARSIVLEGA